MKKYASVVLPLMATGVVMGDVTLNAKINVDNTFQAFVSSDDSVQGTEFLSGTSWPTTYSGSAQLTAPGTYYLHVLATDQGSPEMFIGQFSLDSTELQFENGGQLLLTDLTHWRVSSTGFGANYQSPVSLGLNAQSGTIWGKREALDDAAMFLWAPKLDLGGRPNPVYFSTTITVVPTPGVAGVMALGGLSALRRRR